MVLHLKVWESKSLPGLLALQQFQKHDAGWSSPVARQAHNLKVVGSNPTPATNYINKINDLDHPQRLRFLGFFVVIFILYTNHHANRSSGIWFLIRVLFYFLNPIKLPNFLPSIVPSSI
jgi:hypothetical protein